MVLRAASLQGARHRRKDGEAMTSSDISNQADVRQASSTSATEWQIHTHERGTYIPPAIAKKPFFVSFAWRSDGEKYLKQPALMGRDGKVIIKADDRKPVGIDALAKENQLPYDTRHTGFVAQGRFAVIDFDTPQTGYEDEQREFRAEFEEVTYTAKSCSNVMSKGEKARYHSIIMCAPSILPESKFSCPKLGIDFMCNNKQGVMLSGVEVNLLDVTDQTSLVKRLIARMRELNGDEESRDAPKNNVVTMPGVTPTDASPAPTPSNSADKDKGDAEAIIKAFKEQKIDLCPDNQTFCEVGYPLVAIFGVDEANAILANESGYDEKTPGSLRSMAKTGCVNPIARLTAFAKKRKVKLSSSGGQQPQHITWDSLIWSMCQKDFTKEAMIAAAELLADDFETSYNKKSIKKLIEASIAKDDTERGKVDRYRVCYTPHERESVEFKSIVDALKIEIRYNELAEKYQLRNIGKGKWLDAHHKTVLANLRKRLRNEVFAMPAYENKKVEEPKKLATMTSKQHAELLLETIADDYKVDPFQEKMEEIWDWGKKEFPNGIAEKDLKSNGFLESIYEVPKDYVEVARWIFPAMIRAMIMRSKEPGYKYDYVLTYCGRSGIGKSEIGWVIFKSIGLDPLEFFSDGISLDDKNKEMVENLIGSKLIELSDMKGQKHADSDATKSFITRRADRARLAYDKGRSDIMRRFVITATADRPNFLAISEEDRGRRWVIVRLKQHKKVKNDHEQVQRLRDYADTHMKQIFYEQMLLIEKSTAGEECLMPWKLVLQNEKNVKGNRLTNHDLNTKLLDVIGNRTTLLSSNLAEELEAAPQSREMKQAVHILMSWGWRKRKDQDKASPNYGKHVWRLVDAKKFDDAKLLVDKEEAFE